MENYARSTCVQQPFGSYPIPLSGTTEGYNMQGGQSRACDFMYTSQAPNSRSQITYNSTTTSNSYITNMDHVSWMQDPRTIVDIERGLKYTDKMETIEITSKDLSPASCCSNVDLFIPEFYKNFKDINAQWYCTMNQKYMEYPSCSEIPRSNNFMSLQEQHKILNANSCMQQYNSLSENLYYENHLVDQCYQPNLFDVNTANNSSISSSNNNVGEGSVDGSDIIVEESDDEIVTDCSEDVERRFEYSSNCIVCNVVYTPSGRQFYMLTTETPLTMSSQQPVVTKLNEMLIRVNNKSYLCSGCLSLINTIDHLQLNLELSKKEMLNKYEKTCKETDSKSFNTSRRNPSRKKFKNFCGLHHFKCKLCKKLFSIKKLFESHSRKHKMKDRFLCELCGLRFTKLLDFQIHKKTHKEKFKLQTKINAFPCKICSKKSFRTRSNLKAHENVCSGNLPFNCKECDKKFPTSTKLKNHTKLKHDKKFVAICSICNVGFIKPSDYKLHKLTHSPEKKFNCTKCDKSYKTQSNLNYHMKFHSNLLPFICNICNKGFMRKDYLESHMNNHEGIKNFPCQFCDKKFVSQKNLDAHVKYHDGTVKKKVCNICHKTITTGFEEHLRTHSKLLEFGCDLCDFKFNTKGALAKHVKRKHNLSDIIQ